MIKRLNLFIFLFSFSNSIFSQTIPSTKGFPFIENFGTGTGVGLFPVNDQSVVVYQGINNSFSTNIPGALSYNGGYEDALIQGVISGDLINISPSSEGRGPYFYTENNDASLLLSLSNKILSVRMLVDIAGKTDLKISYKVKLTEKINTNVNGRLFLAYRVPSGSWDSLPESIYSSVNKMTGEETIYSCLSIPVSNEPLLELGFFTLQNVAVNTVAGEVLSFAIDDISLNSSNVLAPALINPIDSLCGSGSIRFNVNSINGISYRWYNSQNSLITSDSTSYTTPILNSTHVYFVEGFDGFCAGPLTTVTALVNTIPGTPVLDQNIKTICGQGNFNFTILNPDEPIYQWYDAPINGNFITQGITYSTGDINSSSIIFVQSSNNKCLSARVPASAIVYTVPSAPVIDATIKETCGSNPITFYINPKAEPQYFWYGSSIGGTALANVPDYSTPSLYNTSTNYWVEAFNGYCTGPRLEVTAIFNFVPERPVIDKIMQSVCGTGAFTYNIVNPIENHYRWYNNGSSVTPVTNGTSFTTNVLENKRDTMWVAAFSGKCESIRTRMISIASPVPSRPSLEKEFQTICGAGTLTHKIAGINAEEYRWYKNSSGGMPLKIGNEISITASANKYDTVWVSAINGYCASPRVRAIANFYPIPEAPVSGNTIDSICGSGRFSFHFSGKSGMIYQYFQNEISSIFFTDTTFFTPEISQSSSIELKAFNNYCYSPSLIFTAVVKPLPDNKIERNEKKLIATSNAASYIWSRGVKENTIPGANFFTFNIFYSGTYYVQIKGTNGCIAMGNYNYINPGGDTIYFEDFQNGIPKGYTILNFDNATIDPDIKSYYNIYQGSPWAVVPVSRNPNYTFFGGMNNYVASATSLFQNKNVDANRWLITDTIKLSHEGLNAYDLINNTRFTAEWKAVSDDAGDFPDAYTFYIGESANDTTSFKALINIPKERTGKPILRRVNIPVEYNGKNVFLAFKLNTKADKGNRLLIDSLMVIARTSSLTKNKKEPELLEIQIYPNPANGKLFIAGMETVYSNKNIVIYNTLGELIFSEKLDNNDSFKEIDISNWKNGIYLLKVSIEQGFIMKKILVQN